jgi:hypothetical protein
MTYKPLAFLLAAACLAMLPASSAMALNVGDPIVGNVFVTGFDGWTDTNATSGWSLDPPANWGVLLARTQNLVEYCNTILGPPGVNPAVTGQPIPQCDVWKLVNLNYTTPSNYTLSAKIGSYDDDGYGLIFGYQDEGNYFRVSCRAQNADSFGYPKGVSVQKVTTTGGVTTYAMLGTRNTTTALRTAIPTISPATNAGVMFDLQVVVSGNNFEVWGNFTTTTPAATMTKYMSGTDTAGDLANMAAGHYGVQSWAQGVNVSLGRGTEVQSVSVASSTLNVTHTFADIVPINWRPLRMYNSAGVQGTGSDDYGDFQQKIRNGTIQDNSNSYEWATQTAPNTDFVGQGVVVDEPGNGSWSDYEMTVRVSCVDDEGPGVLVRVQDEKTFYRVNFAAQTITATNTWERAPQGLSIQKCDGRGGANPVWTELFRDPQGDGSEGNPGPAFVYTSGQAFDLKVKVVGNAIAVSVIDDPDGTGTGREEIDYATVYDTGTPILTGSVGLTNWGGGGSVLSNGPIFSAYGGQAGHALLTYIPEPSTLVLLALLALGWVGARRR